MGAKYDDSTLRHSIEKLKELTGKDNEAILKDISLTIARKCVANTPPKNKRQGSEAIQRDFYKLYIDEDKLQIWADSKGSSKVAKRISDVVKREDFDAAQAIFRNTPHLRNVEVTEFSPSLHESNRDSRGRVNMRQPRYFFTNPRAVKDYVKQIKKRVGYAKASFAGWVTSFGGSVPQWVGRYANNTVEDKSKAVLVPRISMTSNVGFIESLDKRNAIVSRAVSGAQSGLISKAKYALKDAARKAGFKS